MNRKIFKQKFNAINELSSPQDIKDTIRNSMGSLLPQYEGAYNFVIVMEELAELSQEISKYIRGKGDRDGLIEEVTDYILGIEHIKQICDIYDDYINKAVAVKINRLKEKGSEFK